MVFTAGLLLGPQGLAMMRLNRDAEGLRSMVTLTLAMVPFTDTANADFNVVGRNIGVRKRLPRIGPPLRCCLPSFLVAGRAG
jgi:sodium/hydrogen antiporter